MNPSAFLRSINLELDAEAPDRFGHFRPTSKSADLVEAVFDSKGDRALLVVAPYGSGKSLTAGYLLHAVQNEPNRFDGAEELLRTVATRLEDVRPELGATLRDRAARPEARGVVATLYGYHGLTVPTLRQGLSHGFRRVGLGRQARSLDSVRASEGNAAADLIRVAVEKLAADGRDHLLIVWDEFGRHLEGLVENGQAGDLVNLQVLAEAAARMTDVQVTILLLLHRSLAGYATDLPSTTRREWSKIEGRFRVTQFVDDSVEAYQLLANTAAQQRDGQMEIPIGPLAEIAERGEIFSDFSRSEDLLGSAYPLEPHTLWLLPRVSARVAQNERTAFSFLAEAPLSQPVRPAALYDYFRGEFRADTGPGGTHKAWLEAESALSKVVDGSLEAEALKCAFLLNLGLGGERSRASYARLAAALQGVSRSVEEVEATLSRLIDAKLLIRRHHSDHVLLWHGTDVDLRGRLDDERRRIRDEFDFVVFLRKEMPPPIWRPTRHAAETGVPRFLASRYVSLAGLVAYRDDIMLGLREPGLDGEVLYVVPGNDEEAQEAVSLCLEMDDARTFLAVASPSQEFRDAALDLAALLRMQRDPELLSQDPLVKKELDQLTDDVRASLARPMDRLISPAGASRWFHGGKEFKCGGAVAFRRFLSTRMDEVFPLTPEIRSEMVVRRRPTPVIINARKKLVLGVLERFGTPDLGIEGDFADRALFRAVLLNTGLYREDPEPRFARAEELEDRGLQEVWNEIRDFLTEPKELESFQVLFDRLKEPPYGVREGLLPILLTAGMRAFPAPMAIRAKGAYLSDILPSAIEEIVRTPEDFSLTVFGLTSGQRSFLIRLQEEFSEDLIPPDEEGDLLRRVYDAIQVWWRGLPEAAQKTSRLSRKARALRRILKQDDPAESLLNALPSEFGGENGDLALTLSRVLAAKQELTEIHRAFVAEARADLVQALSLRGLRPESGLLDAARRWAALFPADQPVPDLNPVERGFISQMRREHEDESRLLEALSILLIKRAFKTWDDTVVPEFSRRLRSTFDDVEHAAISAVIGQSESDPDLREGMAELAQARLEKLYGDLVQLTGVSQARARVSRVVESIERTSAKGN